MAVLDHLVLVAPDIDNYVKLFAAEHGVTPFFGGRHLGRGTKNYLVGLDSGTNQMAYLEFLGLDETQDVAPEDTMFGVGTLGVDFPAYLHTWAVRSDDIAKTVNEGKELGFDFATPSDASRTTPGGTLLQWRFAVNPTLPYDGLQPFLIDWKDSPHPAQTPRLPRLRLQALCLSHPDPGLGEVLNFLNIEVNYSPGIRSFWAHLASPTTAAEIIIGLPNL